MRENGKTAACESDTVGLEEEDEEEEVEDETWMRKDAEVLYT